MHRLLVLAGLVAGLVLPSAAFAGVPPGAKWHEEYFTQPDGNTLHADVLRPEGLPDTAKTPVIMTISPYVNHSTQNGVDFDPTKTPPSDRFKDFELGSGMFEKGYTYVMVDLPGFGGSDGCTDWGGPLEQRAVKDAVEWAASQPWSTGKVGTYGKSYDGWTGLMGIAQQPKGLAAVVAQEPVYSGYTYEYMNGVRMTTFAVEGPVFDAVNILPGTTSDTAQYHTNSVQKTPWCYGTNVALQQQDSPDAGFWQVRNLIPAVRGMTTPLFLTQGFLEDNTKPDGAWDFFNNLSGPKRGWFGQWDHVRGNERCDTEDNGETSPGCNPRNVGQLEMGREGWFDEVMRFYDRYLKGVKPAIQDPPLVVESGDGTWRSEKNWPPADAKRYVTTLNTGSYADDNGNDGTGSGGGHGVWTISAPLAKPIQLAGVPHVTVDTDEALPNANLVADVYDIDPAGKAILVNRGAQLLRSAGLHSFDLYGNDWPLAAGHRIGVLLSSSNAEWWLHVPTQQTVTLKLARISLPLLAKPRTANLTGTPSVKLTDYLKTEGFAVSQATMDDSTAPFSLPFGSVQ